MPRHGRLGAVATGVSDRLGRPVSLLRIDSVVWQAGQYIGKHEPDRVAARQALVDTSRASASMQRLFSDW